MRDHRVRFLVGHVELPTSDEVIQRLRERLMQADEARAQETERGAEGAAE